MVQSACCVMGRLPLAKDVKRLCTLEMCLVRAMSICTKICESTRWSTHGLRGHQWVEVEGWWKWGGTGDCVIPGTRDLSAAGEVDQGPIA